MNLINLFRRLYIGFVGWLGWSSRQEFREYERNYDKKAQEAKRKIAGLESQNEQFKELIAKQPYDFDGLIENYNIGQMNAMFYKLVNKAWTMGATDFLERWEKRCNGALNNIEEYENTH